MGFFLDTLGENLFTSVLDSRNGMLSLACRRDTPVSAPVVTLPCKVTFSQVLGTRQWASLR